VETPFTQWHEILSQNTRDFTLSYGKNQKSLSYVGFSRYRVVTDRHQDRHQERITIANMLALARKNLICRSLIKFLINSSVTEVQLCCEKLPRKRRKFVVKF